MKTIIHTLLFCFITASALSQNLEVSLKSLDNQNSVTKLSATTIDYSTKSQNGGTSYEMTYAYDGNAKKIEQALKTGKIISNVTIKIRKPNGKIETHVLTNALVTEYTANYTTSKNHKVSFVLNFQNRIVK